jgi:VanZ family protein
MAAHGSALWFWRLAFALSLFAVGYGSLVPGDTLPPIASNDKLLHLLGHGGIAFCAALAFPRRWGLLLMLLPIYGAGLEVLQTWVPNRSFDWHDMVANVSGVLLAFALVWLWRRYQQR